MVDEPQIDFPAIENARAVVWVLVKNYHLIYHSKETIFVI